MKTKATILIVLFLAACFPAFCQDDPRIDLVCEFEDFYDFEAFKYIDTLLYVANRYGFFVYSYDENEMEVPPVELVRYRTRGEAEALLIVDSLCYLADGYAGLRILNISDIYNIHEIGYCEDATNGQFLQLQDDILYMGSPFKSIDVSDPANPTLLCTMNGSSHDFRIHGNRAYSASDNHRYLEIIDISDPSNMQTFREVEFGRREEGQGVEIHDDYLYYVTDEKFRIISIEDPDNLEILCEVEQGYSGPNNIKYFGDGFLHFGSYQIWNVSNPREAVLVDEFISWRSCDWIEVGENVSFSCSKKGFHVWNIENLERVEEILWVPIANGLSDVCVRDDLMFVTSKLKYGSKFDIYNIENINNPVKIGEIDSTEGAGSYALGFDGITVQEDLAILWAWDSHTIVQIYSVEDPRQPNETGEIDHVSPRDLVVDGDFIYAVCDMGYGFKVISIANPENPEVVWEVLPHEQLPFDFNGIDLVEDYAYVICRGRGEGWERNFLIWDRSNPENLELIGQCEVEGFEGKVAVCGDYAYITATIEGGGILSIVTVESPENPQLVSTILLPNYARDIEIEDNFLYISFSKMGFFIYDLENPSDPEMITWCDTPYTPGGFPYYSHMFVRDSYVFLPGSIYDVSLVTGRWNLDLSAESYDFGVVNLNTDSTYQFTISNLGTHDVEILDIFSDSLAFTVDFEEAFTIAPGENANFNITFTPTERQIYSGQLTIHTERKDLTIALSGNGDFLEVNNEDILPYRFAINDVFPNPFNSSTNVFYCVPHPGDLNICLYDLQGRNISQDIFNVSQAGRFSKVFDMSDYPTGVYFLEMTFDSNVKRQKMVLIR